MRPAIGAEIPWLAAAERMDATNSARVSVAVSISRVCRRCQRPSVLSGLLDPKKWTVAWVVILNVYNAVMALEVEDCVYL